MKILFVTDTWSEDDRVTNGVITWLRNMKKQLVKDGHDVTVFNPNIFPSVGLPTYREIRIFFGFRKSLKKTILEGNFDIVHISTEGAVGLAAKMICDKKGIKYSTFYHTKWPEYVHVRMHAFLNTSYEVIKLFHAKSQAVLVNTPVLKDELKKRGFKNLHVCTPGVDLSTFVYNKDSQELKDISKPRFLFLGRIAPEKNLEAFLKCELPSTSVVIGDGPDRERFQKKYPKVVFLGQKIGQELVDILSAGDVLVFPSLTETFGLAIVESMACGLPVAAYDVDGIKSIITNGRDGFLGDDLASNAVKCLALKKEDCVKKARQYSWENTAALFVSFHH